MPNDKWNLDLVRAREAADMLRQKRPGPDGDIDWGEIEVAHIDTGYTRHSVFGPWNGNDDSPIIEANEGLNLIERGELPLDPLNYKGQPGHGTRTCSVLCGDLPGSFVGVAPSLPVIPYRAINKVVIASKKARKRIASAIRHAVDDNACEVISMSLGFPQMSIFGQRHLGEAVDHAYERGVIVVAAGGQVVDSVSYPGKFARTIGVGGVTEKRDVWFKYEKGMAKRSISIWGPADDVRRANSVLNNGQPEDGEYKTGDGTSYATVHVAGAAAMWLNYHRDEIDQRYPDPWQRIEAFRGLLEKSSQAVKGNYWPNEPKGILNIEKLLKASLPDKATLKKEDRKAADEIF